MRKWLALLGGVVIALATALVNFRVPGVVYKSSSSITS
jgi:hypothetical protein